MSIRKSNQKFCTVTSTKDSYQTPKNQILVAKSLNFGRGDKNLVVGESTGEFFQVGGGEQIFGWWGESLLSFQ